MKTIVLLSVCFLGILNVSAKASDNVIMYCETVINGFDQFCDSSGNNCDPKNKLVNFNYPLSIRLIKENENIVEIKLYSGGSTEHTRYSFEGVGDAVSGDSILAEYDLSIGSKIERGFLSLNRYTGELHYEEVVGGNIGTQINYIFSGRCKVMTKLF